MDPVSMPGGIEIHGVWRSGEDYTAWKDWPQDRPGHYKCGPIMYLYAKNLENRPAQLRYRLIYAAC
jgi:hypothetical protein